MADCRLPALHADAYVEFGQAPTWVALTHPLKDSDLLDYGKTRRAARREIG